MQYNIDYRFSPNVGTGAFLYSENSYYGVSVPNLLETKYFDGQNNSVATKRLHYYLIAGHVFDLSYSLKFKTSMLTKVVSQAPLQVDLSANFLFHEKFAAGIAYHWSASISALAGFQITDSWFIGYAYDTETTNWLIIIQALMKCL